MVLKFKSLMELCVKMKAMRASYRLHTWATNYMLAHVVIPDCHNTPSDHQTNRSSNLFNVAKS